MQLLSLPHELVLDIWDTLATITDKNAFSRTCNYTYEHFNSRLYTYAVRKGRSDGVIERAIEFCGEATMKKLLDAGLDPNDPFFGETPLLVIAAAKGRTENARLLLDAGADINAEESDGTCVAASAVNYGHADVLNLLLERGVSMDFRVYGEPPLISAVQEEHEDIVDILLANKADVDERGALGTHNATALAIAARGHEKILRRLLRAGADIESTDRHGQTPLHWAVRYGDEGIVKLLLEEGANPHITDQSGHTALSWACCARLYHRNERVVGMVLQQNVDTEAKSEDGRTPLSHAAFHGFLGAIKPLLENNADPATTDNAGRTPIALAAQSGYTGTVFALMEHTREEVPDQCYKRYIDKPDDRGRTPLFLATLCIQKEIVEILLSYGSSAKQSPTCAGRTPLSIAGAYKKTEHLAKNENVQHIWDLLHCYQSTDTSLEGTKLTSQAEEREDFDVYCNACDIPISPYDTYLHCGICEVDDFDICQECAASGRTCTDRTHTWQKMSTVNEDGGVISEPVDQDSLLRQLTSLSVL